MTTPFDPITLVEEFVFSSLSQSGTLMALIPGGIYPEFSPDRVTGTHLTHDFYGPDGGRLAVPVGQGASQIGLDWVITAWIPGMNRQPLRPVMKGIQTILAGADRRGRRTRFASADSSSWDIQAQWGGPSLVRADVTPIGTWQRVSHLYEMALTEVAS